MCWDLTHTEAILLVGQHLRRKVRSSDFVMTDLPEYVQLLQVFELVPECWHIASSSLADCNHYTVFCQDEIVKNKMQKHLLSYVTSNIDFSFDKLVTHTEIEQGTQWTLFAGTVDLLYTQIEKWSLSCPCCIPQIRNQRALWKSDIHYVFHLAVRCDPRMQQLIERISIFDNTESCTDAQEWQTLLNAAGEPCIHIAARLGKLEVIKRLLLQNPKLLNAKVGARAHTLLHAVGPRSSRIVGFLMSKDRMPKVDVNATNIHGDTPLEWALSNNLSTANTIYNLLTPQDRSNLNPYDLLSIIFENPTYDADHKSEMAEPIMRDLTLDPINACKSPYNAVVNCYLQEKKDREEDEDFKEEKDSEDCEEEQDAAKLWKLLNDNDVPLRYFDEHGTTPIAYAVEYAPRECVEMLAGSSHMRRDFLNWSTTDSDGDTPHDLAMRRGNTSILQIVEKEIKPEKLREALNHFNSQTDYRSAVGLHFALKDFIGCLKCLDQLEVSTWRQCMKARTYLNLGKYRDAQDSLAGIEECSVVLRLKSSIFLADRDLKSAFKTNRVAYGEESRFVERVALQRELCMIVLLASPLAACLPLGIKEQICRQIIEP